MGKQLIFIILLVLIGPLHGALNKFKTESQSRALIKEFLSNPEEIVNDEQKLITLARFISKTMEEKKSRERNETNITSQADEVISKARQIVPQKENGRVNINKEFVVKRTIHVNEKSFINEGRCEGDLKITKVANTTYFEADEVRSHFFSADKILSYGSGGLIIHGSLLLGKFKTDTPLNTASFLATGVSQWRLLAHDSFEDDAHQWNFTERNNCPSLNENYFLGGHCALSSESISKTFFNLPKHKHIRITATFHMFDNWQGEVAQMSADGEIVWKKSGLSSILERTNICGNLDYADPLYNLKIDKTVNHQGDQLTLKFSTNLNKNPCDASYAIDDVLIYVK